ncbi:hypothetical protein, partial [Marinobacterium sedimentorum]
LDAILGMTITTSYFDSDSLPAAYTGQDATVTLNAGSGTIADLDAQTPDASFVAVDIFVDAALDLPRVLHIVDQVILPAELDLNDPTPVAGPTEFDDDLAGTDENDN